MILDERRRTEVREAFAPLVGLPLSDMWRYAGCQKLEFGEQRPHLNRKGEPTTWADWGLVVSCAWRIEGPGGFRLSSDHFGKPRTDEHAYPFYDSLEEDPPTVESIQVEEDGGLCLGFSKGYTLRVLPDEWRDSEDDQWRLMPPEGEPRGHLVLEGACLEWSGGRRAEGDAGES